MRVLIVNSGSSTLKLTLLSGEDDVVGNRELETPRGKVEARALEAALEAALLGELSGAEAVGHRIVHGGQRFHRPVRIDPRVRSALNELAELAPLHQPRGLAALASVDAALPELPQVACFDTAFHAQMPARAATYALPERWRSHWGVRRYGFHGLSHAWVARRVPQLLGEEDRADELRIVSCHLGAGASVCAIAGGRSVDTTMGFTPLDGLVMATRCGSIDPALVLWLLQRPGVDARSLAQTLEHNSGLLALGGSADMRELLARAREGNAKARLALEVYAHSVRAGIAAMTASLGGLDALAFTGGIGQSSATVRRMVVEGLDFLGVELDERLNERGEEGAERGTEGAERGTEGAERGTEGAERGRGGREHAVHEDDTDDPSDGDRDISTAGAPVSTFAIATREDLEIAREVRELLAQD